LRAFLPAALVALTLTCARGRVPAPVEPISVPPVAPQPPAPPLESGSPLSATPAETPVLPGASGGAAFVIDGRPYTQGWVDLQRQAYVALCASQGIAPVSPEMYRERLIDELLILRAAQRDPVTTAPVFLAELEAQRRHLIDDQFINKVLCEGIEVTDQEVEAHYGANLGHYTEPAQVRVREMQFSTMQQAQAALRRISVGGEDFDLVAQSMGVTPTDSGWFSRGQIDLNVEQAAFNLQVGQVSSIVPTDIGYLILLKVGAIPERTRPLRDVADSIRRDLRTLREQRRLRDFLISERLANGFNGQPALVP
jgi:peptidyl-prolyl cis-trans isomerase C